MNDMPNVLLIVVDTLRADHLPEWGYHRDTSEHMQMFFDNSHIYRNAYSHFNTTTPSVAAILTGKYHDRNGIREFNLEDEKEGTILKEPTLANILGDKGYHTFCINSLLVELMDPRGELWGDFDYAPTWETESHIPYTKDTVDSAIDAIEYADGPWFTYVHDWMPHYPWLSDYQEAFKFYGGTKKVPLIEYLGSLSKPALKNVKSDIPKEVMDIDDVEFLISWYDAEIWESMKSITRLLLFIEKEYPDTMVILTADHGEGLGERGKYFVHSEVPLFNEVIHVPLAVRYPNQEQGKTFYHSVSNVRVFDLITSFVEKRSERIIPGEKVWCCTRKYLHQDVVIQDNYKLARADNMNMWFDRRGNPDERFTNRVTEKTKPLFNEMDKFLMSKKSNKEL